MGVVGLTRVIHPREVLGRRTTIGMKFTVAATTEETLRRFPILLARILTS